ncbi:MAG: HAD family hydrolase [Georgenia sp.]
MTQAPEVTVVFDLGNVVVGWDPYRAVADHLGPKDWSEFVDAVDFPTLNLAMDGGLTLDAAVRQLLDRFPDQPEHAATLRVYRENFANALTGPIPGTSAIIAELKAFGVPLLGLTNWAAETFHHAEEAAPAIGLLDDVVVSGREGLVKPDPALFRVLLERYDLDAGATVFIDDSPANVAGAARLGITARRFTDGRRLRTDLTALGLLRR